MRGGKCDLHKPHRPMKKIFLSFLCSSSFAVAVQASILGEDPFDYTIGSSATTWTGGSGFSARWTPQNNTNLQASIVNGLTFGSMSVSGNALHYFYEDSASGLTGATVTRKITDAVSGGNLWLSYLYQFDVDAVTAPAESALQVRFDTTQPVLRSGINEDTSALFVQYNAAGTKVISSTDEAFKDGTTLLMVYAFYDLGDAGGSQATGWALTVSGYESLLSAGLTEANLDVYALASASTSVTGSITLTADAPFTIAGQKRGVNNVTAFTIDEIKFGTSLADVIAIPEPQALLLLPLGALALGVCRRRRTAT